jgi:protein phosphatase
MYDFGKAETVGKRSNQEDYCAFVAADDQPADGSVRAPTVVATLADGMGGHVGGQVASRTAVTGFNAHFARTGALAPNERLHNALIAANEALAETRRQDASLEGMGCTLIGAVFEGSSLRWVSVGDSVIYLYRGGELIRLNADHSMAPELDRMAARNEITQDQARQDPMRHALRSALMGDALHMVDQPPEPYPLVPGDWIVIASDGIETLDGAAIKGCIERSGNRGAQNLAEQLVATVEAAGNPRQDNTAVMAVHLTGQTRQPATGNSASLSNTPGNGHPSLQTLKALAFGCVMAVVLIMAVVAFSVGGDAPENGNLGATSAEEASFGADEDEEAEEEDQAGAEELSDAALQSGRADAGGSSAHQNGASHANSDNGN